MHSIHSSVPDAHCTVAYFDFLLRYPKAQLGGYLPWADAAHLGCLRMSPKESPPIRLVASIMFWKVDSAGQEVKSVEAKVHAMFLPFLLLKGATTQKVNFASKAIVEYSDPFPRRPKKRPTLHAYQKGNSNANKINDFPELF